MPAVPALHLGALLNPGLLALGIGLAAVPIIIHLLNRRRVRPVQWAAMAWLLAAMKRNQKRLKMENWLILALRVLALILLGLALARPVLTDSPLAGLFGQKRSVYLLLDTSYSTEAKSEAASVGERIRQEAERVIESLGTEDSIAILTTNDPDEDGSDGLEPAVLQPRTLGRDGATRARESLVELRARHAPANFTLALERVREQMRPEDVNRTLIIVTDLQARDWLPGTGDAEGDAESSGVARVVRPLTQILRSSTSVEVIDRGARTRRNLAITRLENRTPQGAFVGRPLFLEAEVANYGAQAVRGAILKVWVGDKLITSVPVPDLDAVQADRRVPIPVRETVRIDLGRSTFRDPGPHAVRVEVGPPGSDPSADALGLDSERWLALSVRRRIQVLGWTQASQDTGRPGRFRAEVFLRGMYGSESDEADALAGTTSLYEFDHEEFEDRFADRLRRRDQDPVDLVVIANQIPTPKTAALLRTYVREGGGLLVFTGDRVTQPDLWNASFHGEEEGPHLSPLPLGPAEVADPTTMKPWSLDLEAHEGAHPVAYPFTNAEEATDWIKRAPPRLWGRTKFIEGPDAGAEGPGSEDAAPEGPDPVVLRFESTDTNPKGPPAIVAGALGEGRTMIVGTSVDYGWLGRAALFLPVFLEEAALYLTRPADLDRNRIVGQSIELPLLPGAEEPRFAIPGGTTMVPTARTEPSETNRQERVRYDLVGITGLWKLTSSIPQAGGESTPVVDLVAVNANADEGMLLGASADAVRQQFPPELDITFHESFGKSEEAIQEVREGETTRTVLWILLGLLVLESFLAMRFGQRGRTTKGGETS